MEKNNGLLKIAINCLIIISFLCLITILIAYAQNEDIEHGFEYESYILPAIGVSFALVIVGIVSHK